MNYLLLAVLTIVAAGCRPKSEFDISPDQVQKHVMRGAPGDLDHLPPGAVKHTKVFHKGDKLPDGSISPGERKMVTVEMGAGPKGAGNRAMLQTDDMEIGGKK